jgi:hypothetical protein
LGVGLAENERVFVCVCVWWWLLGVFGFVGGVFGGLGFVGGVFGGEIRGMYFWGLLLGQGVAWSR